MSSRKPFGFATNFDKFDQIDNPDKIKIYANKKTGFVLDTFVQVNRQWINKYKVLMPKATEGSGTYPNRILTAPIVSEPHSVCTETYIVLSTFSTNEEAVNFSKYIKTRFFRFLVAMRKVTQDATAKVYASVPDLPMTEEWTDQKLYVRYEIDADEQAFIESMIKEMP